MNLSKGFILCQVRHKLTCQQIGVILRCRFADYQDETSQINQSSLHVCVCVCVCVCVHSGGTDNNTFVDQFND